MKDFLIVIAILLIAAGWGFFVGHAHTVQLRYDCGIEVPWYDALWLKTDECPGSVAAKS